METVGQLEQRPSPRATSTVSGADRREEWLSIALGWSRGWFQAEQRHHHRDDQQYGEPRDYSGKAVDTRNRRKRRSLTLDHAQHKGEARLDPNIADARAARLDLGGEPDTAHQQQHPHEEVLADPIET